MRGISVHVCWMILACLLLSFSAAVAQQVSLNTPFHSLGGSFFERMGVQWGLNFPGGFARFGGPNAGMPPSGRFDPNAGLGFGFGFRGGDINGFASGSFGQSVQRSFGSQTPMLTLTSGVPGYVGDVSISPFVMGYVPVVGGYPIFPVPPPGLSSSGVGSNAVRQALPAKTAPDTSVERLAAARASSAGQPAPSVAEARRLRAAETEAVQEEARLYWQKGQSAEKAGNLALARIYYGMAAKRATGPFQQQILGRLEGLKKPRAASEQ